MFDRSGFGAEKQSITLLGRLLLGGGFAFLQLWLVARLLGFGLEEVLNKAVEGLALLWNAVLY